MKIVHITERPHNKPVTRSRIGNTNDIGVAWCFGATEHLAAESATPDKLRDVDAVIYTMAKNKYAWEERWLQRAWEYKQVRPDGKLLIYQEAEAYWPQQKPWDEQKQFYELLKVTDLFLTHNVDDEPIYKLMCGHDRVRYFPAVTDLSMLDLVPRQPASWSKNSVVVAAYHWRWGGIQAALTAQKAGYPIVLNKARVFTDGRDEDLPVLFGIQVNDFIPMLDWTAWATEMGRHWAYLHPMPGTAAGRDQIACAVIGLPIIGNHHSTAQQVLWPELSADPDDIYGHMVMLNKLEQPEYYAAVVNYAKERTFMFDIDYCRAMAKQMTLDFGWSWEWNNQ